MNKRLVQTNVTDGPCGFHRVGLSGIRGSGSRDRAKQLSLYNGWAGSRSAPMEIVGFVDATMRHPARGVIGSEAPDPVIG